MVASIGRAAATPTVAAAPSITAGTTRDHHRRSRRVSNSATNAATPTTPISVGITAGQQWPIQYVHHIPLNGGREVCMRH